MFFSLCCSCSQKKRRYPRGTPWKETTLNGTPDRMKLRFVFYRIEFVLPIVGRRVPRFVEQCFPTQPYLPTLQASSLVNAWPNWFRALEVPGSNPPPYRNLDLFSVVPSSTTPPRCVNSQLDSLPLVGIPHSSCSICNIY